MPKSKSKESNSFIELCANLIPHIYPNMTGYIANASDKTEQNRTEQMS